MPVVTRKRHRNTVHPFKVVSETEWNGFVMLDWEASWDILLPATRHPRVLAALDWLYQNKVNWTLDIHPEPWKNSWDNHWDLSAIVPEKDTPNYYRMTGGCHAMSYWTLVLMQTVHPHDGWTLFPHPQKDQPHNTQHTTVVNFELGIVADILWDVWKDEYPTAQDVIKFALDPV